MNSRFSPQNVEAAMVEASNPMSTDQQTAITLLNEWSQDPTSIFTALQIVESSQNPPARFMSAVHLSHGIPNYWGQVVDPNAKNQFRLQLLNVVTNTPPTENTLHYFIESLCNIAVYDWPEEWPDFTKIIFGQIQVNNSIKIFSYLLKNIDNNKNITDSRRNDLRNFFVDHLNEVMPIITQYFNSTDDANATINVDDIVDSLNVYNFLLRWAPLDKIITFELFQKLALAFLTNESTCKLSIKCFYSIFIDRTDSSMAFRTYSPFLARALSKGLFTSNGLPVTSDPDVLDFVIKFLGSYSSVFELFFISNKEKLDQDILSILDESVIDLISAMQAKGVSTDDLHDDLIHLFQVILSIPVDQIQENFWKLWDDILKRIQFECHHKMIVSPTTNFFMPMMEQIRNVLYNALPSAVSEEGTCIFTARTCMATLVYINPANFIEFIKAQAPSPQLCYAIGAIEFVTDRNMNIDSLQIVVVELLNHASDTSDSQFLIALLFVLSHSTKYFAEDQQLFARFIEFVITCMSGNEKIVSTAATHALHYVVQRRLGLFKDDSSQFTEQLIESSERYLQNLEPSAAIRIFKVCTWLIYYNNDKSETPGSQLFAKLFEPIMAVVGNAAAFPKDTVETSLEIITECALSAPYAIPLFYETIWVQLGQIAAATIPNIAVPSDSVSYVLNAISAIQIKLPFEQVMPQVVELMRLMQQRGRIEDCFFNYFLNLRHSFKEMNEYYSTIHQALVLPVFNSPDPPPTAVFNMLSAFDTTVVDIEWMTMVTIGAISDLRTEVCDSALYALQEHIMMLTSEQYNQFISHVIPQLISALIGSIVDMMHKQSFTNFVSFMRFLITSSTDDQQNLQKAAIVNALKQTSPEPQPQFFDNFGEYIISVHSSPYKFKAAFANLLVVLRKASPGDAQLFEVEPIYQNSIFSMLFDAVFNDWGKMFNFSLEAEDIGIPGLKVMKLKKVNKEK
ncbi:hypothetical protein TRFO_09709 [Tritrichomonas foetus]|uniref:Importin N-terminal domain-containing protein n=1 Tax=Tritrichomonas foetus TaxID=1144522 RepID=A0A1J4JEV1_9EUKA|nr:hypothetical protein TRFO_09709 [Tritrichomonas foetus]|eukprot:OHS96823.1 hypothetical protein TRFO_09709 [Tritrichomonas foetus]